MFVLKNTPTHAVDQSLGILVVPTVITRCKAHSLVLVIVHLCQLEVRADDREAAYVSRLSLYPRIGVTRPHVEAKRAERQAVREAREEERRQG